MHIVRLLGMCIVGDVITTVQGEVVSTGAQARVDIGTASMVNSRR